MDSRLVMVVAMVAVACLSLGAKANNTTEAMNATSAATTVSNAATDPMNTATTGPSTMAPSAPAATGPSTMTPGVPTTGGSTMTPGVPTTGPSTMTPGVSATGGSTMTPGVPTTGPSTMTPGVSATGGSTMTPGVSATGGSTMTPGVSATGGSTMTPGVSATGGSTIIQTTNPFVINSTVETFTSNITRDSCRKTQFCASEPSTCNPSSESCFFVSAAQSSGQVFSFQLNGPSTGYIAMGLATSAAQSSNVTTYVCANSNGVFKFFTTFLNNGELVMTSLPVNKVKGVVRGKLLQCAFTASLSRASGSSRAAADNSFIVSMSDGTFTNDKLGTPTTQLRSTEAVDLSNVNSTVTNNLTATSAPAATTAASHGITLQRSLSQALLILLGVLGLAML